LEAAAAGRGRPPAGGELEGGRLPAGGRARHLRTTGSGPPGRTARPCSEAPAAGSGAGGGGEAAVGAGRETDVDGGCGGAPAPARAWGGEEMKGLVELGSEGRGGGRRRRGGGQESGVGSLLSSLLPLVQRSGCRTNWTDDQIEPFYGGDIDHIPGTEARRGIEQAEAAGCREGGLPPR